MATTLPIHKAVIRHPHALGGDRELVYLAILIAVAFILVLQNINTTIFGIVLVLFVIPMARRMYKADPLLKNCYIRYLHYQPFYSAHSTPFCRK